MKTPYIIGGVALVVVVAYILYAKNKNKGAPTTTQNASTSTAGTTTTTTTTTTPGTPTPGISSDLSAKLAGADYKYTHAGQTKYIDTAKNFWGVTSPEGLAVQKWLNRFGAGLVEDGNFGPASQRALTNKYGGAAIQPGVAQYPKDTIARIYFQDGSSLLPSRLGVEMLAAINATPL